MEVPDIRKLVAGNHLSKILGIASRTLVRWRCDCGMPSMQIGRARLYYLPDVAEWIEENKPSYLHRF